MNDIDYKKLADVYKALEEHHPEVTSLAYGYRESRGHMTREPAAVVGVDLKLSPAQMFFSKRKKLPPNMILRGTSAGLMDTDVQERNVALHRYEDPSQFRSQNIWNVDRGWSGSGGPILSDIVGTRYQLTNRHVAPMKGEVFESKDMHYGDTDWVFRDKQNMDISVILLADKQVPTHGHLGVNPGQVYLGDIVYKNSGRSGWGVGIVTEIGVSRINDTILGPTLTYSFMAQPIPGVNKHLSIPGDSGSTVYKLARHGGVEIVGVLYGAAGYSLGAVPIMPVMVELDSLGYVWPEAIPHNPSPPVPQTQPEPDRGMKWKERYESLLTKIGNAVDSLDEMVLEDLKPHIRLEK